MIDGGKDRRKEQKMYNLIDELKNTVTTYRGQVSAAENEAAEFSRKWRGYYPDYANSSAG